MTQGIQKDVSDYYSNKLREFGPTPEGVDWNGQEGQECRFEQLLKVVDHIEGPLSINDYGCGYGSLFLWMEKRFSDVDYLGLDLSEEMVQQATQLHGERFVQGGVSPRVADVSVASGIFNVRMQHDITSWEQHVKEVLDSMNDRSLRGFSFNCLTSYSDKEFMREDLYYADPAKYFDFCKREYSPQVSLLHDYGLYEFTIIVRKP
ncbi:MAG: class I SAM-dependent methyltransferase [Verrucomicrobiota bacterium]